jgi:hypothetical protein
VADQGVGTNDKAGGSYNLMRWISPDDLENYLPPLIPVPYKRKAGRRGG